MADAVPDALLNLSSAELAALGASHDGLAALQALTRVLRAAIEQPESGEPGKTGEPGALGPLELWLLTPWTRPVDIELNLRLIRALELGDAVPGLLRARAPLRPGSPARARARAEGLTRADASPTNWSFADPRLPALAEALDQLSGDEPAPTRATLDRAIALVELAARAGPARDGATLLAGLPPTRTYSATTRVFRDAKLCDDIEEAIRVAVARRLKPVRRPSVDSDALEGLEAAVRRRYGPDVHVVRTRHHPDEPGLDIAYGYTEAEVLELAELSARATSDVPPEDFHAVTLRIGELLGYPRCCVEAFLALSGIESDVTERTLVARRLGLGALDPRWPLLLLVYDHYMPCALDCAASLAKADALEAALAEAGVAPPPGGWGSLVFFTELERQGNVAVLERGEASDEGFRYRMIALNHGDDSLAPLLEGDELRFATAIITVLREGQPIHHYAGNAAVFDTARSWGDEAYLAAQIEALLAAEARGLARIADHDEPAPVEAPDGPGSGGLGSDGPGSGGLGSDGPGSGGPGSGGLGSGGPRLSGLGSDGPGSGGPGPDGLGPAAPGVFVFDVPPSAGQIRAQIVAQIESRADPRVTLTRCEAGRAGDSEVEWIAAQLDGALGRFSLTIVPRPLAARGDAAGYVCGVAPRFDPSGDLDGQRALASELAEALDGRAVAAADAASAEALAEVRAITQPASGAFETFAGYAACWPIRDTDGLVRLALVARGRVLELLVGPRAGRERWPGQAGHLAVAYREDTPLRSPRERAAFAQLVRRLRE